MSKVLIAGGTGLVGKRLSEILEEKGYSVCHLSRRSATNSFYPVYQWDLKKGFIEERAFQDTDFVINLAGAGIADRHWTTSRKK